MSGGTAPYTYTWYYRKSADSTWSKSGATGSVYDPTFSTATTWYCYVYVTDKNGNTKTSSTCTITVSAPLSVSLSNVTLVNNVASHYAPTITGGSGNYSYYWTWSGADSGSSTASYLNFYGKLGTIYVSVTVTDKNTGATGSASATVTMKKG